ncbi:putative methyltransferase DDB_G0268948 [Prunus persica]|nr:putative methyltransferase DDB_G0268948 [Prunus persica]
MLAALTPQHSLAWDLGEHYEQVIGSDISESQLKHALQHPRVHYIHTPVSMSDDELVALLGGENSVDLVTVAEAVHWFDLPKFYSLVKRVLRKPGGVIAVWGYNASVTSPTLDGVVKRFYETAKPFRDRKTQYLWEGYRTLPFPFQSVGLGSEGEPLPLEIPKEMSFEGILRMLRSSSAVTAAKGQGVDLLSKEVIEELETTCKAFMLAGKV